MGKKLKDAARRNKQFWISTLVAAIFAAVLIKFILPIVDLQYHRRILSYAENARVDLAMETQRLAVQVREIVAENNLLKYINDKDVLSLISILDGEKKKRGIEFALITDRNGIVLTRLQNVSIRGDNYFQTTAQGRLLAGGQEVAVVERSRLLPLAIFAGQPIKTNDEMSGSFVAARALNDSYAVQFKEKYLSKNAEIFFYDAGGETTGSAAH